MAREVAVLIDHDLGVVPVGALEALTAARGLADRLGASVTALVPADDAQWESHGTHITSLCGAHGAQQVAVLADGLLTDYGPHAWASAVAAYAQARSPVAVTAVGTDRGAEVMAVLAALLDAPLVANCVSVQPGAGSGDAVPVGSSEESGGARESGSSGESDAQAEPWRITRVQWGGSLLEDVTLAAQMPLLTFAHHSVEAVAAADASPATVTRMQVDLDESVTGTMVTDRIVLSEGVTLSTASVVVSGGRGVGSADGFACLEELADLLGGKVGCSRAVTNNGWRSHADQVGQTGTRIAPDIYIACGISGAIQHWVGAMASKNILAINIDPEANMVSKAGYALIADLHEAVPAICDEIRHRRDRPGS